MKTKWILTTMAAITSGAALAAGGAGYMSMSQLDQNNDGQISRQEAQSSPELSQRFQQLDQNSDMMLDQSEFAQFEAMPEGDDTMSSQPGGPPKSQSGDGTGGGMGGGTQ